MKKISHLAGCCLNMLEPGRILLYYGNKKDLKPSEVVFFFCMYKNMCFHI